MSSKPAKSGKKSSTPEAAKLVNQPSLRSKQENQQYTGAKRGKQSLYDPKKGAKNHIKALGGRFAEHPAYLAIKNVVGAHIALQRMAGNIKSIELRIEAVTRQLDKALNILGNETKKLKGSGDKIRFAEVISSIFNPPQTDDITHRICWMATQMRTEMHEQPSQAELRQRLKADKFPIELTDEEWKRTMKRTGLNKKLPTDREKRRRGTLRS